MIHNQQNYPGRLFVVEGTDGSGKSTQLMLLHQWLRSEGYPVFFSEWNSSPLVKDTTRRAKKQRLFTPTTFSLLHATDFADRTERDIIPPLKAGAIVLADRYIYTAFARDVARGCDAAWVRDLYSFAVRPTVAFYFRAPLEVAVERILAGRPQLKYYEAGLDMNETDDAEESFKMFQGRILDEYDNMRDEFGLTMIDATRSIERAAEGDAPHRPRASQAAHGVRLLSDKMKREMKFYGTPLAGVSPEPYSGRLIVIEGTDGVGRSTQIALLRSWLEARGHAVLDTGMTRSVLAARGIKEAKEGHTLGRHTMQLFYATDFADRLEQEMLPALRSGFIVLTDRYIYSAIARAVVRGMDAAWMRRIYDIALVPDAVFYLRINSAEELGRRVLLAGRQFDYWESGMDMRLGEDFYDSFIEYQTRLLREFDRIGREYDFRVIDASRSIKKVASDLRRHVARLIDGRSIRVKQVGAIDAGEEKMQSENAISESTKAAGL